MKTTIIQKTITKIAIGVLVSILWDRYIRFSDLMTIAEFPLIFFGAFYYMLAWFNYLKLDGLRVLPMPKKKKDARPTVRKTKQMIDYVDTEIQDNPNLDPLEKTKISLISNLICGTLFTLPAFIYLFIK